MTPRTANGARSLGPAAVPGAAAPGAGERVPTGIALLDALLLGGLPARATVLLAGPPYSGKELVASGFARAAAQQGAPLLVGLTRQPPGAFAAQAAPAGELAAHEARGCLAYVDCYGDLVGQPTAQAEADVLREALAHARTHYGTPQSPERPRVVAAGHPLEPARLLGALEEAHAALGPPAGARVLVLGLTDLLVRMDQGGVRAAQPWVSQLLARLRAWRATTLLTVEQGVHPVPEVELLLTLCDGALELREEQGRPQLRVRGLPAATRDWVEYALGPDGLAIVGSFTERKIR